VQARKEAAEQFDAGRVVHLAIGAGFGVVADAVFGDVDLRSGVFFRNPLNEIPE
jgi:hypothetical protein